MDIFIMHEEEYEFFGHLNRTIESDDYGNGVVNWVITNHDLVVNNTKEIEDGDFLEVYDSMGQVKLSKIIYRDHETFYNKSHRRQLYNGMSVSWVPEKVSMDYWLSLFNNNYRARIIKEVE